MSASDRNRDIFILNINIERGDGGRRSPYHVDAGTQICTLLYCIPHVFPGYYRNEFPINFYGQLAFPDTHMPRATTTAVWRMCAGVWIRQRIDVEGVGGIVMVL